MASVVMKQFMDFCSCNRRKTSATHRAANRYESAKYSKRSVGYSSDDAAFTSASDAEASSDLRRRRPPGLSGPPGLERNGRKKAAPWKKPPRAEPAEIKKAMGKDHDLAECLREIMSSSEDNVPSSLEEVLKRRLQREHENKGATPAKELPNELEQVLGKLSLKDAELIKKALMANAAPAAAAKDESEPPKYPRRAYNSIAGNTLRANLQKLATIDSQRVFMVRKIRDLGLESTERLKEYFAKFGKVEHVLVTHSVDNRNIDPNDPEAKRVVRPASVGFVVMEKVADVQRIFEQGLQHIVNDVDICLTAYEHHDPDDVMKNESKFGLQLGGDEGKTKERPRFPTYANITEENTLRANLRKLAEYDADRVFMVRKINKLGLGSAQLLKSWFSQVGGVTQVFVTHSIDRRKIDAPNGRPLVRPAGIGFVVMDTAEGAVRALQNGMEQTVFGVQINLATYEHQIPEEHQDESHHESSETAKEFSGT